MFEKISLKNVSKKYGKSDAVTYALKGISLDFFRDDFTSIVGSSGAGKSTLLSILATLEKPTEGDLFYDDMDILKQKSNKLAELRNKHISFIFQQFHLIPTLTAIENVLVPIFHQRTSFKKETKGKSLLDLVGLSNKVDSLPSQLSGGQQQRVAIARALITEPDWIFADEPTGNLDSETSQTIFNLLLDIKRNNHCGIIMVTHEDSLAKRVNRRVEIEDGQIIQDSRL